MSISFDFSDQTVVVTGAGRGIGRAIARAFAANGASVYALDATDESFAEARADGLADATFLVCDVSSSEAVDTTIEAVVAATGRVDVLVNNAGITRDAMLWKITDDQWQAVLGVHLTGTFNCTRAAVPVMRANGYGRIVNVTSYTGLHGNIGQANYAAAKAGIIGFTRTAAKELARFEITVNAVSPNAWTPMVQAVPEANRQAIIEMIPMRRFGEPHEMAHAVTFLAARESAYITGVVLPVDGGLAI
ncbi:MAG TPA: 3-oxoacyl-ACP reductase FabG [Acidimicrobiales bacterium]|jgi:3-oxoacyl-[acyl-carrier protein] reductase|nr:3-oxoacyl-ACP reductase FabG [Acidimicrobiales bacterium]